MEGGDLLFELLVDVLGTADEADRRQTEAMRAHRINRRLNQLQFNVMSTNRGKGRNMNWRKNTYSQRGELKGKRVYLGVVSEAKVVVRAKVEDGLLALSDGYLSRLR